jgi:hypothetical protein
LERAMRSAKERIGTIVVLDYKIYTYGVAHLITQEISIN